MIIIIINIISKKTLIVTSRRREFGSFSNGDPLVYIRRTPIAALTSIKSTIYMYFFFL